MTKDLCFKIYLRKNVKTLLHCTNENGQQRLLFKDHLSLAPSPGMHNLACNKQPVQSKGTRIKSWL